MDALTVQHPRYANQIAAYDIRWEETLGEAVVGTVEILDWLRRAGQVRLIALTNWSQEKFPLARARFPFLGWFEAIMVSGEEGIAKPDAEIFDRLRERFDLTPAQTLFIDDSRRKVDAAKSIGFKSELFRSPEQLVSALETYGLRSI